MAALIGARLASHIQGNLSTKDVVFCCDIHWLKTNKPKKFISNRLREINDLSATYSWKYCRYLRQSCRSTYPWNSSVRVYEQYLME
ncbi:hypothetical protein DPMN_171472 [Dreissena polymorpha]|uniref:Uncharacterized protein n=1 Tax=Dreissena polymorpha TaxID=45954 RepID=A0A9D4E186_DREPO|nr:hypothetical protein DPMN_171472 [Dreissena polymorpha]